MNSRDMCMIEHIPELIDAGIDSFKIEGRMKSSYYAAVVTNAYRHAIDAAVAGAPLDPLWVEEVNKVSHRPYTTGFYFGDPGQYYHDATYFTDADVAPWSRPATRTGTPCSASGINSTAETSWSRHDGCRAREIHSRAYV